MLRKNLLCGALALTILNPSSIYAANSNSQTVISDSAITSKVKALYALSPLVKSRHISVSTRNHEVILSGRVNTDLEYERAVALAESVEGVDDINAKNLKVRSSRSPLTDTYITAKVKGTLLKEKLFGGKDIEYWPVHVETKNKTVYLTGKVESEDQRIQIINLVQKIDGIRTVESSIIANS